MSHSKPATTPAREKTSRARPRQKYSAARAFYLTILVMSAFAAFSLFTSSRARQIPAGINGQLFRRNDLAVGDELVYSSRDLVRRDEAVCLAELQSCLSIC